MQDSEQSGVHGQGSGLRGEVHEECQHEPTCAPGGVVVLGIVGVGERSILTASGRSHDYIMNLVGADGEEYFVPLDQETYRRLEELYTNIVASLWNSNRYTALFSPSSTPSPTTEESAPFSSDHPTGSADEVTQMQKMLQQIANAPAGLGTVTETDTPQQPDSADLLVMVADDPITAFMDCDNADFDNADFEEGVEGL